MLSCAGRRERLLDDCRLWVLIVHTLRLSIRHGPLEEVDSDGRAILVDIWVDYEVAIPYTSS